MQNSIRTLDGMKIISCMVIRILSLVSTHSVKAIKLGIWRIISYHMAIKERRHRKMNILSISSEGSLRKQLNMKSSKVSWEIKLDGKTISDSISISDLEPFDEE